MERLRVEKSALETPGNCGRTTMSASRNSKLLLQTFAIMGRSINNFELRDADIVVRPQLPGVSSADFSTRKRSIQAGREAMQGQLAELKSRILAKTL